MAHRAWVSPVGNMEPRGLMMPIKAKVGFCRCAGKIYLYSDAWPSSTFTTDSSRKGKANVYPVAKTMISTGSSFGALWTWSNTTEFSLTSFTLDLIQTFPVMIRPGSSSFSTGSLSCILNNNNNNKWIERHLAVKNIAGHIFYPYFPFNSFNLMQTLLDRSCRSWEKLHLWKRIYECPMIII